MSEPFIYSDDFLQNESTIYVVARDPDAGMILLGGLGFQAIGQMWRKEDPLNDPRRPGYADARIADAKPGLAILRGGLTLPCATT